MIANHSEINVEDANFISLETKFSKANEDRAYIISIIILFVAAALLFLDCIRWQNGIIQNNLIYQIIAVIHVMMALYLIPVLNRNYKFIPYKTFLHLGTNSLITFILCCSVLFPLGFVVTFVRDEMATFLLCIAIINLVFEADFKLKLIVNAVFTFLLITILFLVHDNSIMDTVLKIIIFLSVTATSLILAKFQFDLKIKSHQNEMLMFKQNQLLIEKNDVIEKKNNELRSFAYASSHDLKEPLRMIGSYTGLLKRKLNGSLDDDTEEYMGYITKGVHNMNELVDELLNYATIDNYVDDESTVKLSNTFVLVQNNLRAAIHDVGATIEFQSELPSVRLSSPLASQLFQNLVSNALKFRKPDVSPLIKIDCKIENNDAIISLQDNGIGIAENSKDKIFEIFTKIHEKHVYDGHGIGLASCAKIVERAKGKIWVESELDSGSCFFIKLPLDPEYQNTAQESASFSSTAEIVRMVNSSSVLSSKIS